MTIKTVRTQQTFEIPLDYIIAMLRDLEFVGEAKEVEIDTFETTDDTLYVKVTY